VQFCGISGDTWSVVIQIAALVLAFAYGVVGDPRSLTAVAVALGLVADVLGQFVFAGGGPGAFAGLMIIPIVCVIAAHLGCGLGWLLGNRRRRALPSACPNCGYDPAGNVTVKCPKCGTALTGRDAKG
jgi:hypothetical protein